MPLTPYAHAIAVMLLARSTVTVKLPSPLALYERLEVDNATWPDVDAYEMRHPSTLRPIVRN